MPTKPKPAKETAAKPEIDSAYDCILKIVGEIEARLDDDAEVGLVTIGHPKGFNLVSFEENDTGLIVFYGYDHQDKPTVVVQDEAQLNLQFVVVPKRLGAAKRHGGTL